MEKVKFNIIALTDNQKIELLNAINEVKTERNHEEIYWDDIFDYDYFTYDSKNCELKQFKNIEDYKKQKVKIVNALKFFKAGRYANTFENRVDKIFKEMKETLVKKHADYGNENLKKYGEKGIIIRLSDKMARLDNIYKGAEMQTDSHKDTYMDIIGYAVQAIIMLEDDNKCK